MNFGANKSKSAFTSYSKAFLSIIIVLNLKGLMLYYLALLKIRKISFYFRQYSFWPRFRANASCH